MNRLAFALALAAAAACTTTYDYEPTTAGPADGGQRALRDRSSNQFVRGVYADLLGRAPAAYGVALQIDGVTQLTVPIDEQAQLVAVLDGIGDALPMRNLLVNGLVHGAEIALPDKAAVADPGAYIGQQFTRLLGREPSAYELAAFTDAWRRDPAVGPRTILRAIAGSREYQSQ